MEQTKTFERSRDDRVVFGVCGGIARALGIDPTIVRVVTVVLVAVGGVGLLAYVVAALLLPEEGGRAVIDLGLKNDLTGTVVGVVVVSAVVVLLVGDLLPQGEPGTLLVLVAVGLAAWLLIRSRRAAPAPAPSPAGADPAADPAPPAPGPPPEPSTAVTVVSPRPLDTRPQPAIAHDPLAAEPAPEPEAPAAGEDADARAHRARRRASGLIAWGVVLVGLAAGAAVLQEATDAPRWDLFAAASVAFVGLVLLLAAPFGGARGLLVCGFLLAGGVGVAAASDITLDGGLGERVYRPANVLELRDAYRLGAGTLTLDLSQLDLPPGTTTVDAEVGVGELLIDVPPDADVVVDASANGGEVVVFGTADDGLDVETTRSSEGGGDARLEIDAHVGFGNIDVERAR